MKKNDEGMRELLELLKTHPELINALVFDPASIKRLLKSKAARRLVLGVDTKAFLRSVAASKGGPVAVCLRQTALMRADEDQCWILTLVPCKTGTVFPCKTGTILPPLPTLPPQCRVKK